MATWELVRCLESLRDEINELAPDREKYTDGSVGDSSHSGSSSDHNPDETGITPNEDADDINEVHAIDVDKDLRKAGWSMSRVTEIIVTRHRTGQDNRLQNVIWNRRIASRSWGWTWRSYGGPNAHTEHAHFSARYGSGTTGNPENNTRPWGLLEKENEVTPADRKAIVDAVVAQLKPLLNPWDDTFGRGEFLQTAGDALIETRNNVRRLVAELETEPPNEH